MKTKLIVADPCEFRTTKGQAGLPSLVEMAGSNARFAWNEFFAIDNDYTKAAYERAVRRFLSWCEENRIELTQIMPGHVSLYEKGLKNERTGQPASKETRKQHLSAIRKFFDVMVIRHAILLNPAKSVRGAKVMSNTGKTPPIPEGFIPELLSSIDIKNIIGLRDRAILGVMLYTAVRRGAVSKLRLKNFWSDGRQRYLRFDEKGSKQRDIPVRHDLQQWLEEYIDAAEIGSEMGGSPLFRGAVGRGGRLSEAALSPAAVSKMVKRRFKNAGLPESLVAHSFRATAITNLLKQGVSLESVQDLAGHADPRTTRSYDHSGKAIARNVVERISYGIGR